MFPLYYIEQVSYGCGDGVTLHIRWNRAQMIVDLDPNPSPDAAENFLIKKCTSACLGRDEEEVDAVQDEILDAIIEVGASTFDQFAPPPTEPQSSLHLNIFPPQYCFRLVTVGGTMKLLSDGAYRLTMSGIPGKGYTGIVPVTHLKSPKPQFRTFSFHLDVKEDLEVPRYLTTDIQVLENLLGSDYITHVLVNGCHMCAKVGRDFDGGAMQREMDCLAKITASAAQEPSPVNVPKLLGLIETPNDGHIIGILEELIPHPESQRPSTLATIDDITAISKERREAWLSNIRQAVDWLHNHGIIWGDGKADNVLIHPHTDEAWLIDFGGGTTEGWVDENLAGTIAGDNQAVEKIHEFLQISEDLLAQCLAYFFSLLVLKIVVIRL